MIRCSLCGSENTKQVEVPATRKVLATKCNNCGTVVISPGDVQKVLDKIKEDMPNETTTR